MPVALLFLIVGWLCNPAPATPGVSNLALGISFAAFFIGALLAAIYPPTTPIIWRCASANRSTC